MEETDWSMWWSEPGGWRLHSGPAMWALGWGLGTQNLPFLPTFSITSSFLFPHFLS